MPRTSQSTYNTRYWDLFMINHFPCGYLTRVVTSVSVHTQFNLACATVTVILWSSSYRVIKPSSSISQRILFLYHWTLEGHPKCRDVSWVSIATSVPCFLLPVHIHTLCLHHGISISFVVLYCKCIQFSVDWGFSRWARGCCDPWLSLLLEGLHRCVASRAALLSSSHTVQFLRRSPLVVHLSEKVVLTSDGVCPNKECLSPFLW